VAVFIMSARFTEVRAWCLELSRLRAFDTPIRQSLPDLCEGVAEGGVDEMGFLGRSITDQEWAASARAILDAAAEPAAALSEAIRQEDIDQQVEAIGTITLRFPSLRDSLRSRASPTSAEARQAKKSLELALQDYVDGAKQGYKLLVDVQKGLARRATSCGFAGRAATSRFVFQKSMYEEIVKKAERRLEAARAFLYGAAA
jgi:hypothetical protein